MPFRLGEKMVVTSDLKEAIGKRQSGETDDATFMAWQESFCFSAGTCSMMGTANTMGSFLEAIGVAPFGSTTMLAFQSAKVRQARDVGECVVHLVCKGMRFSKFFTPPSLENGIRLISATGGSTNAVLHILAFAKVAGIPLEIISIVQALVIVFIAAPAIVRAIYRLKVARDEGKVVFTRGWGS